MNNLLQVGIVLTAIDKMSGVMASATSKATQGFAKLQNKISEVSAKMTEMGTRAAMMGKGVLSALETPIAAFADLDEASTNLRVAVMDNLGRIPPQFEEINRQAIGLGNVLPGTTADFVQGAQALIEKGATLSSVVNGGLKAASYLGVILKIPQNEAGELTAKFREVFGLAENELTKMADLTQRAKFSFGLAPDEIKYAAQYLGGTLSTLKLAGAENAKMVLAIQGLASQHGVEGSVFGTNFSMMLTQTAMLEQKLGRNSKIMKEVNADLRHAGIQLQFFDSAGDFIGLEKMVAELEKLNGLNQQDKLQAMNKLFGSEGMRVASILADAGVAGLQDAMALMDKQASIQQRIDEVNKSAKNTWEALTGTIENFWAAVGGPMVTALYPLINKVNEFVGGPMMDWVSKNQDLVKWLGLAALAVGGLLVGLGGLGIVAGAIASGFSIVVGVLGAIFSPITLIVLAIAGAAALIIANWSKISAFFRGLWQGLTEGLAPLKAMGPQVASWFAPLLAIGRAAYNFFLKPWVDAISQLIGWFGRLIAPIVKTEAAAQSFGVRVGQGIAAAIKFVATLVQAFFDLPGKVYDAGVGMMTQLLAGIKSAASKLYAGVADVASKVRDYWPFSPAKTGPLRDLHRVRIIETIADNVQAAPLTKAIGAAAAAGMMAFAPLYNTDAQAAMSNRLGRRVPIAGVPAAPQAGLQTATTSLQGLAAAKAASLMNDPRWQDPRLQAILRRQAGMAAAAKPAQTVTAAAKPVQAAPAPIPVAQAAPAPRPRSGAQSGAAQGGGMGGGAVTVNYTVNAKGGADKGAILAALKAHENELVALIEQVMRRNARRKY